MIAEKFNAFLDYPQAIVPNKKNGALSGLTLAVKDIFDVAGYPSGWGNPQHAAETGQAAKTAPAVQALLESGARFVGKTQTDELAFSLMGQNSHFPYPINPAAPDRITGGSSSGSAAAVAGGLVDIATGSDTGGSIRAPASFCGLIGLRATHGAISLEGTMPLAPSFDTFGWFARDMEIYEKVAQVLLGSALPSPWWGGSASELREAKLERRGGGISRSVSVSPPPRSASRTDPPHKGEGGRSVLLRPLSIPTLDQLLLPNATAEYRRIRNHFADILGDPRPALPPHRSIDELYWCFRKLQSFEAWQSHGAWLTARDRGLGIGVKERFEFASTIDAQTARQETANRNDFRNWLADLLGDDGVLILPTVPSCAPRAHEPHETLQAYREQALRLLCWSGLSGFPQLTLPLGTVDNAPFGISLLGPAGSDLFLLALGQEIMKAGAGRSSSSSQPT